MLKCQRKYKNIKNKYKSMKLNKFESLFFTSRILKSKVSNDFLFVGWKLLSSKLYITLKFFYF